MNLQLQDKIAFISGSTKGIGFAAARSLLREGAAVIINGRTAESVDAALYQLHQEFQKDMVSGIVGDFSNKNDVASIIDQINEIDILINNVGIYKPNSFFEAKGTGLHLVGRCCGVFR